MELKNKIDLTNRDEIKNLIANTESGIYSSTSDKNENVIVNIQQKSGMDIKTHQSNGWWRVEEYDSDGFRVSESYEK